ncbi:MAG: T9SS type A sorting domain-containing protein [Ignavibacteriae bacterium]|nr:T9SS type A sorting domain-containing protein [Ignavibacteriota bacterium]
MSLKLSYLCSRCLYALIVLSFTASALFGQTAEPCSMSVGMNLSIVSYFDVEQPFKNILKSGSHWLTSNSAFVPGGENAWDTGLGGVMPVDSNGYPLQIPFSWAGVETTQVVKCLMNYSSGINGNYPTGTYVCLYDGTGEIAFGFDAVVTSVQPGRIEFQVTQTTPGGILMTIVSSDSSDHIRNIRVLIPGSEQNYEANPFNEAFLEKLEPFSTIRFMQWGRVNDNPTQFWNERTTPDYYTQGTLGGAAYEYMIKMCNILQKDMWICVPHMADSTYISNLARLVADSLDPSLTVYLEYSNETWNGIYSQTNWVLENAPPELDYYSPRKYAYFVERLFRIWMQEFEGQENRVVRVAATFLYSNYRSNEILTYLGPGGCDALAPSGYFYVGNDGIALLDSLGASATAADIRPFVRNNIHTTSLQQMQWQAEVANAFGVDLILYEAGQHITTEPFGTVQPYQQAIWDLQVDTAMYNLYNEWMNLLRDSIGVKLFTAYMLAGPNESQYGSWGAVQSIYDEPPYPPKYQALLEQAACGTPTTASESEEAPRVFSLSQSYPNPFNGITNFELSLSSSAHVELKIYDLLGREVTTLLDEVKGVGVYQVRWNSGTRSSGVYFARMRVGGSQLVRRFVLQR